MENYEYQDPGHQVLTRLIGETRAKVSVCGYGALYFIFLYLIVLHRHYLVGNN